MLVDHEWSMIIFAKFASQVECQMQCLVLSNIFTTLITGQRNPCMRMGKLQHANGLGDEGEVVRVDIEQPWQFDIVLGTLEATVCAYF